MIQNSEVIQEEIKILYAKNLLHGKKNQKHVIKGKHIFAIYIKQYKSFLKQEKKWAKKWTNISYKTWKSLKSTKNCLNILNIRAMQAKIIQDTLLRLQIDKIPNFIHSLLIRLWGNRHSRIFAGGNAKWNSMERNLAAFHINLSLTQQFHF